MSMIEAMVIVKSGELALGKNGENIFTVLGSCISVCIFDVEKKIGGINHYLLPEPSVDGWEYYDEPLQFGIYAIPALLKEFKLLGSQAKNLQAKIIGGSTHQPMSENGEVINENAARVGAANLEIARRLLRKYGISIVAEEVGGFGGRKVEFNTFTGELRFKKEVSIRSNLPQRSLPSDAPFDSIIAIGASTGGVAALTQILLGLSKEIPPILIVQHMPPVFTKNFAERLNAECSFQVKEAEDGERIQKGCAYIAPGGKQMALTGRYSDLRISITDDPPENRFKPSVDYLFRSLAKISGKRRVAILLTGMGSDGALELLSLKKQGVYTIVEDESTSVVFGMPKVAIELGAACEVKQLDQIASAVLSVLRKTA